MAILLSILLYEQLIADCYGLSSAVRTVRVHTRRRSFSTYVLVWDGSGGTMTLYCELYSHSVPTVVSVGGWSPGGGVSLFVQFLDDEVVFAVERTEQGTMNISRISEGFAVP